MCVVLAHAPCAADELPTPAPATDSLRLAIAPSWTHAFLPASMSTDGVGLGVDFFPGRRAASGRLGFSLVGALYRPFSGEPSTHTAAAFPLSETSGFVTFEVRGIILSRPSFELHVFGGMGAIGTRPVSVVDPAHRHFDFDTRLALSLGAALRVPLTSAIYVSFEGRDVIFINQHENAIVALGEAEAENRATWFGDKPLVHMIEVRVGLTFVLFPGPS